MTLNTTRWRKHPQSMRLKAAFIRPVPVLERRVNQTAFAYPLAQVTYDDPDTGTGVYSDVQQHMTLAVLDGTSGDRKGLLRVRKAPTSSILYINETSAGDVDFADNDRLVVYDDYRLWARVPRMAGDASAPVFYKDYDVTHTDEAKFQLPVANAGPHIACDVDPTTNIATITFDGSASIALADNAAPLAYSWYIADGTLVSGSLSASTFTATFPPGQRWVRLTITDDNGKVARAVVAVITCDSTTNPAVEVKVARLNGHVDTGWECAVTVLAEDVSDLLPGTLMILYANESYGDETGAVQGISGREGVKFVGWLAQEDAAVEPFGNSLTLTAKSALGILQTLPGYSASFENELLPTQWHHLYGAYWFRALAVLLTWHTTVPLLCDIERPDFWTSYQFRAIDITGGTAYNQGKGEAERAWSRLTCDRAGRLYCRRNPHLMTDSERATLTTTVALTAADWREAVRIQRRAQIRQGWLRGSGWTSSLSDPELRLALAPGDSPGPAPDPQGDVTDRWIVDQAELNIRLGHQYAWVNNTTPQVALTLSHQGLAIDPAWQETVALTLDAASNRRGIAYTAASFVPVSVEFSHDAQRGVTTERLTLEPLAYGAPATTQPVPDGDWQDSDWTPDPPSYDDIYLPPDPPGPENPQLGLVYASDEITVRRSPNFPEASFSWEIVFSAGLDAGTGYIIRDFQVDRYNQLNVAQVVVSNGSTPDVRIYRTTNLADTTPTWTLVRTIGGECWAAHLQGQHEGTWFLQVVRDDYIDVHHTHDHWTTITSVIAAGVWSGFSGLAAGGFLVSGWGSGDSGLVYCGQRAPGQDCYIRRSVNNGGTFGFGAILSSAYKPIAMAMPWQDNEDEQRMYVGVDYDAAGIKGRLYRSDDAGISVDDISPLYDGTTWGPAYAASAIVRPIAINPLDGDVLAFIGGRAPDNQHFFVSADGGDTWTHQYDFEANGYETIFNVACWPFTAGIWFVTTADKLLFSQDDGLTWAERQWAGYTSGGWCDPVWGS